MIAVEEKLITVREFLEREDFEEGYLYELINGEIVKRGSPNTGHQRACRKLFKMIDNFVEDKTLGECFFAPYDVIFNDFNVLQPDIIFVSNANKGIIQKGCIEGVPDLLVEILSPRTFKVDKGDKRKTYRRFGVREYWIVDPKNAAIEIYSLKEGDYELISSSAETGEVESEVLSGLKIPVEKVFPE